MVTARRLHIVSSIAIALSLGGCGIRATSQISTTDGGYVVEGSASVTFKTPTSYEKKYGDDSPGTYVSCISDSQTGRSTVRIATHGYSPTMPDASEAIEFSFADHKLPSSGTLEARGSVDEGAVRYFNQTETFEFMPGTICVHFIYPTRNDRASGSFNCYSLHSYATGRNLDISGNWSCKRLRL